MLLAGFLDGKTVCDVGCGVGRVADIIPPDRYVGIDIDEEALERARHDHPDHAFREDIGGPYPGTDICLFQTVLQHIPDDKLGGLLARTKGNVLIVEYMHPWLRGPKKKNAHHRSRLDYIAAMRGLFGSKETMAWHMPTKYQVHPKRTMSLSFLEILK